MKVSTSQPFKIIYSLFNHEYLGYIFESFVVQLDANGNFTFQIQNISSKNIDEFKSHLDQADYELAKLIDAIQQDAILKKFNPKKLTPVDFFLKIYDPQKGDKGVQEVIANYLEVRKAKILEQLEGKELFIMSSDGNPLWKKIVWEEEEAKIRFHFVRNEDNTHYFPTILHNHQKLDFQYKNAILICDDPAWLIVESQLFHFEGNVDGKKIRPFLSKKFIAIPRKVEEVYYRKFIVPLISSYNVVSRGFEIKNINTRPTPVLTLTNFDRSANKTLSLFNQENDSPAGNEESDVIFDLSFKYDHFTFGFDTSNNGANVHLEKKGNDYLFYKIQRDNFMEKKCLTALKDFGLKIKTGRTVLPKAEAFGWLNDTIRQISEAGIIVRQNVTETRRYFLGYSTLDISIMEDHDWFDIKAKVLFGEFEIPFIQLKNYILKGKKEFTLPNGEIAVIPEAWFTNYTELFSFSEYDPHNNRMRLKMHHLALVQELGEESLATTVLSRKLERLRKFEQIDAKETPKNFHGVLRPYQKAGYDWLSFLNQYRLGGCLADDMGLGKTVQTLALLQLQKEENVGLPSLLILPTSLLYNWTLEANKFTPELRVLQYIGTYREKDTTLFADYDLIITSYGIVRLDIDLLKSHRFHYVILDESQAIKNPSSIITTAVGKLNSAHRLILTGTPVENSTLDLWSQMTFVNPGLLGSQSFFKQEFQIPIEKKNDTEKSKRLYNLIKPFILRRNKSQVATDLPEKVENIQYCDMSESQEKVYEEAKSYYRNLILDNIDKEGFSKSHLVVLQGLTRLRQIANHPKMTDSQYASDSGKFEDVLHKIETVLAENHKILIFSQYVKHLDLFRTYLSDHNVPFAYLDGSTKNRQEQVEYFQNNEDIKLFLISLKAGGLGLNLTAADYVFILDPWWNPAIEAQAIDRAHRIGQERTVFTYKFITKNTVEEKILLLQNSKKQLAAELISSEDSFLKSLSKEDILQLLA